MHESVMLFKSGNKQLVGIHHHKNKSVLLEKSKAVIIVVGGPQTRVGSHRQFVSLARSLAKLGIDVFRFDYTGAGDSEGKPVNFEQVMFDIHATMLHVKPMLPYDVEITLWGLCDAASAILLYLQEFNELCVNHLVLLNPWVYQRETAAKTRVKYYYWQRLKQASFWKKLLQGRIKVLGAVKDINQLSFDVFNGTSGDEIGGTYITEMLKSLVSFQHKIDIILSEKDLVAQAFLMLIESDEKWYKVMQNSNVQLHPILLANHTFAKDIWKEQVKEITYQGIIGNEANK